MTAPLTPAEHRDVLVDLFTQVTHDAAQLGLSPVGIQLRTYEVSVQMNIQDTAAVDALADAYGLPADDGTSRNYMRLGRMQIAGHDVTVDVYTGRPAQDAEVTA